MIKSPQEIRLEVLHKKQVISTSNHKAAKIFVKGLGFSKHGGLSFGKEQYSAEKLFL